MTRGWFQTGCEKLAKGRLVYTVNAGELHLRTMGCFYGGTGLGGSNATFIVFDPSPWNPQQGPSGHLAWSMSSPSSLFGEAFTAGR